MSLESWNCKLEPCSPPLGPDSPSEWSVQEYELDSRGFASPPAVVPSRADLAQQLLDDIEEYVKEEESFSNWFEEEKAILLPSLPIFDDLQQDSTLGSLSTTSTVDLTPLTAQGTYLKQEVTYTLGHGHLTPPQSPPAPASVPELIVQGPILTFQQPSFVTLETCESGYSQNAYLLSPCSRDVAREMAVVDEVVRGVAQEWEHLESSDSVSSASFSPDESDDPEWEPSRSDAAEPKTSARRARRNRPYAIQDRRQRKKEQNKTAAIRYRLKKKAEVCTIVDEERILDDKNTTLRAKVTDIEKEISYLKGLMREMFRAKGLIK